MGSLSRKFSKQMIGLACCASILSSSVAVFAAELQPEEVAMIQVEVEVSEAEQEQKLQEIVELREEVEQEAKAAIAEEKRRLKIERVKAKKAALAAKEEARVAKRQEVVDFALQFVGNPYVYGGTSLTNGADCSGFVMSVFANFGYSLPRVASAQAYEGTQKSLESLEAGDLVFYGGSGINHVALYIGNGQIVHASTAATGIKISEYDYEQPCMAATYLE